MAGLAAPVRQVAYRLHPHEPLGQERGLGAGLCGVATEATRAHHPGSRLVRQYQREGTSGRHRSHEKTGPQAIGKSRGGWTTKLHLVAADARTALTLALSPGQAPDAPEGRRLLRRLKPEPAGLPLLMDRAYEGDATRQLARELGFTPVVPPKRHRVAPWTYDRQLYRKRNEVERLFRRLKAFRRIFTRFDKLDVLFLGFIHFALIVDALR